jgi:hypothetical protein
MLGPRDNAIILAPLALLRAPGRTIGTVSIAGFRANEYRWPVGWRASEHPVTWPAGTLEYEVPSLGLNIVASGPLALRVLATLRRTPITTRTYPSEGVTIAPSSDPVPTGESPAGALKSFRAQDQSALLGADLATETPTVIFAAVTEEHPTDAGIKPGQPYDAWVVTYARSPVVLYGPGTGTLPPGSHCQFVAIQDAGSRHWTNFFQNCS